MEVELKSKNSIRDARTPQPGEIVFNTMRYRSTRNLYTLKHCITVIVGPRSFEYPVNHWKSWNCGIGKLYVLLLLQGKIMLPYQRFLLPYIVKFSVQMPYQVINMVIISDY